MITVQQAAGLAPQQRARLLEQVNTALKKNRKNADALLSGAALYYAEKRVPKTVGYLQKAFVLQPNNLMVAQWLCVASAEIRDFKTAKAASAKLVALDPRNPENWEIRGRILDGSGDTAGAIEAYEKLLSTGGEQAETFFRIANCHSYLGNMEKAESGYRRAVDHDPLHSLALYGISTVHRFGEEDIAPYLEQIETAANANSARDIHETSALYFGAAKALDDVKRYDDAFAYYKKANDLGIVRKASQELTQPFVNARAVFTPSFLADRASWGDQSRRPIFVLGMPRSGTTLIESMIAAHPKVTAGGELPLMSDIASRLGLETRPAPELTESMERLGRKDVNSMVRYYLDGTRSASGGDNLVTDKMPHNFLLIGLIFLLFPNAKVIHCLRDPLDTCVSIYTNGMTPAHNYYKSDLAALGDYYKRYLDLMKYWHEVFPGKILDVHYEDVVANEERNSRDLMEFIGLRWQDGLLNREASQQSVRTLSVSQVRQPIYTTAMGKWRRYEPHLSPLLESLGDVPERYGKKLANQAHQAMEQTK